MRRRAAEFRRPIRRKLSYGICFLLGVFSVVGLVLFFLQHSYHEDRLKHPLLERNKNVEHFATDRLNFTKKF
ncbi:unnamed protein product [Lathyrus oleraceus]